MTPQEIMRRANEVADTLRNRNTIDWQLVREAAKIALESIDTPCPDPWERAVEAFLKAADFSPPSHQVRKDILAGLKAAAPHIPGEK